MTGGNPQHTNTRKERFSLAYINAVAVRAGYEMLEPHVDIDSADGILISTIGRRPSIYFQAKATSRPLLKDDHLVFPLPLKNFDDLRAETVHPRILVVVLLPENEEDWMQQDEERLLLRRCGYWLSLRGASGSGNQTSVSVIVPRAQVFDAGQLRLMMDRAAVGPEI